MVQSAASTSPSGRRDEAITASELTPVPGYQAPRYPVGASPRSHQDDQKRQVDSLHMQNSGSNNSPKRAQLQSTAGGFGTTGCHAGPWDRLPHACRGAQLRIAPRGNVMWGTSLWFAVGSPVTIITSPDDLHANEGVQQGACEKARRISLSEAKTPFAPVSAPRPWHW